MRWNTININFHGIDCPRAYANFIKQKMASSYREAAEFSSCDIVLSKMHDKYKGVLTLRSEQGKTIAIFHGKSLDEVIFKLFKISRKKLKKLRPQKFHHNNRMNYSYDKMYLAEGAI